MGLLELNLTARFFQSGPLALPWNHEIQLFWVKRDWLAQIKKVKLEKIILWNLIIIYKIPRFYEFEPILDHFWLILGLNWAQTTGHSYQGLTFIVLNLWDTLQKNCYCDSRTWFYVVALNWCLFGLKMAQMTKDDWACLLGPNQSPLTQKGCILWFNQKR